MDNQIYNTVYVCDQGFVEIDSRTQNWLNARQQAWKEHEFLAKSGSLEFELKRKKAYDNNHPFRNFQDF